MMEYKILNEAQILIEQLSFLKAKLQRYPRYMSFEEFKQIDIISRKISKLANKEIIRRRNIKTRSKKK